MVGRRSKPGPFWIMIVVFRCVRQSGLPELRMADLSDTKLIELSRALAAKLWESDPYLRKPEHAALRERIHLFWQGFMAH